MVSKVQQLLFRADSLEADFNRSHEVHYIDEAIVLVREALAICSPDHPKRAGCLTQLASHLWHRYNQLGETVNINEAIDLDREALILRPPGHQDRSTSLNNLSLRLLSWYEHHREVGYLKEAIDLNREALELRSLGHPSRGMSLYNLAMCLWTRYEHFGMVEDMNQAIALDKEGLVLPSLGHPNQSVFFNNIAVRLWTRYKDLGKAEDLDEAIFLHQNALKLRPPGHPRRSVSLSKLATCLFARFQQLRETENFSEAIHASREALALRSPGYPEWSATLENLTAYIAARSKQPGKTDDLDEIFSSYIKHAHVTHSVSFNDLSASRAWVNAVERFHSSTILLAYKTALRLHIQHITAHSSLPQNFPLIAQSSSLAIDGFSAFLRHKFPTGAIELLEEGRTVFWDQLNSHRSQLRLPVDELVAISPEGKALADKYLHLTSLIHTASRAPGLNKHDHLSNLNFELEKVMSSIRQLPNISRFLLPPLFSDLRQVASCGPVIIVNASKHGCDALVISIDKDPIDIPLPVTKEEVQELSSKFRTLILRSDREDVTRPLEIFLREIWDRVVFPIANTLLQNYSLQSRIWWCPTAEFSRLPLHAADPYRKDREGFSDLYISSYIPTLGALIHSRESVPLASGAERTRFVAIGPANVTGTKESNSDCTELANIRKYIDGTAIFTSVEGRGGCVSRVTKELDQNQWVHLACHGIPNAKQPSESAFSLNDGHLNLHRITQCNLKSAEFAFLSACQTIASDEEGPNEVIDLAAAMQYSGFRSVIGTMYAVDDAQLNEVTSVFYKYMVEAPGCLDHTHAASALWKTVRTVYLPLDQRILYVHIGA